MKHPLLFPLLLFFGSLGLVRAQVPSSAASLTALQQAPLVFEGHLVKALGYTNADSSRLYTASIVQVSKVFRGHVAFGRVWVISSGPAVQPIRDPKTRAFQGFRETTVDFGHGGAEVAHGPRFPAGVTLLLFCQAPGTATVLPRRGTEAADASAPAVEAVGQAAYLYGEQAPITSSFAGEFSDKQALYRYLADRLHVAIPGAELRPPPRTQGAAP